MKVKDLKEQVAQYNVAHRAAVSALNGLSNLFPAGAKNPDVVEAFTGCRLHLIEALFWHQYLDKILTTLSDEGQVALKEYIERQKEAEAKQTAEERKIREAEEKAAGCVPQEVPEVPEGQQPDLKFVSGEACGGN